MAIPGYSRGMLVNIKRKSLAERRKELESNRSALADASIHFGWVRYGHQAGLEARTIVQRLKAERRRYIKAARAPITKEWITQNWPTIMQNSLPEDR